MRRYKRHSCKQLPFFLFSLQGGGGEFFLLPLVVLGSLVSSSMLLFLVSGAFWYSWLTPIAKFEKHGFLKGIGGPFACGLLFVRKIGKR